MKEIYKQYQELVDYKFIPTNHCVVCYRLEDECECEDIVIMEKLESLEKVLNKKLKIQGKA